MNKGFLESFLAYNIWANERIANAVLQTGESAADLEQKSSFNTIKKTLQHIYNAERTWLMRLKNEPDDGHTGKTPENLAELCSRMKENSAGFKAYIQFLSEASLQNKITYKNTKGITYTNSIYEIVLHVVNHASYHRGQLVTMMRFAGHTAFEPMDYIAFVRK